MYEGIEDVRASLQKLVQDHSKRSGRVALWPGSDYEPLADFFRQLSSRRHTRSQVGINSSAPFVVVHELGLPGIPMTFFNSDKEGISQFKQYSRPSAGRPQLVFLRGFPKMEWLEAILECHKVDPALFQRHLFFPSTTTGENRNLYTIPLLPSASSRIFQLNVTTICSDDLADKSSLPEDIESLRREGSDNLRKYHMNLKAGAAVGDSIVRQFSILSRRFSVLEQTISVGINVNDDNWSVIAWTDHGHDLSKSLPGPWCPEDRMRPLSKYMLPIIRHRTNLALRNDTSLRQAFTESFPGYSSLWQANQNSCLLPFQYGEALKPDIMSVDVMYALNDVFELSAASENQFLNLAEDLIEHEMEVSRNTELNQAAMLNIRYLRKVIVRHLDRITETTLLLSDWEQLRWPQAVANSAERAVSDAAFVLLQRNFRYLKKRAERLVVACNIGMQALAMGAAHQERVKGVENGKKMGRLTMLATIFVPLTFSCSVFGMNFDELGSGKLGLWIFFPVAAGVMALAFSSWYIPVPSWWWKG